MWTRVGHAAVCIGLLGVAVLGLAGPGCGSVTVKVAADGATDQSSGTGGRGSGGAPGSGGASGSGGVLGSGGGSGSGGIAGSGGASGSDASDASGAAGASGSGGGPGSGGASGSGGNGGASGSGGTGTDTAPDKPPCICNDILLPVCGTDGKTYTNACTAACAGVAVAHTGACLSCNADGDCMMYPLAGNDCCGVCQLKTQGKPPMVACLIACRDPITTCTCVANKCTGGGRGTDAVR